MITKVVHGWRVSGLMAYLMGPGRAQEHVNPRVIATWDGRDAAWQPTQEGELGPLVRALRAPAVAAGLGERQEDGKRGYVWHCSARVAEGDRVLSDGEWARIAQELLEGAGVASRSDSGGPRWVAVRHADDHIHIAVVLVRQDTCRRFWPLRDYPRLRGTARRIERRLGLTLTAAADGTAARAPGRGEIEKAQRQGRVPARVELSRLVREAAVASANVDEFTAALRRGGCLVELRLAPSGDPLGYKVARRGDVTAAGDPVFYSGSKLAADLSLPRLRAGWAAAQGSEAEVPVAAARRRVEGARGVVASASRGQAAEDVDQIVASAHAVLTAIRGWSGELDEAATVFDRAARAPRGSAAATGPRAAGLRRVARQLVRQQRILGVAQAPGPAALALAVALSDLVSEIAQWQRGRGREHQSAAAQTSAQLIGEWAARHGGTTAVAADHGAAVVQPRGGPRRDRSPRPGSAHPRG